MKVAPEAMQILMNYPWYGNVRELKNLIERIVVLKDGDTLQAGRPAGENPHEREASRTVQRRSGGQ